MLGLSQTPFPLKAARFLSDHTLLPAGASLFNASGRPVRIEACHNDVAKIDPESGEFICPMNQYPLRQTFLLVILSF